MGFSIIRKTSKYVEVKIQYISGKMVKHSIRDYTSFMDAAGFIQKDRDIIALAELCRHILGEKYLIIRRNHAPTRSEKKQARARNKAREAWYNDPKNIAWMERETERMVNHPGFLGHGVTRKDVDSVIEAEVKEFYYG